MNKHVDRQHQQVDEAKRDERAHQPSSGRVLPGQVNNAGDALGYRVVIVPRPENSCPAPGSGILLLRLYRVFRFLDVATLTS